MLKQTALKSHQPPAYALEDAVSEHDALEVAAEALQGLLRGAEGALPPALLDALHGDVTMRLRALMPLIGHVQTASVPERHEPGTGEIGWRFTRTNRHLSCSGRCSRKA